MKVRVIHLEETELRKADRTVGMNCNIFKIYYSSVPQASLCIC